MYKKIMFLFIGVVLILNVVGLFILPNDLVMQVKLDGDPSWVINKYIGIPLVMAMDLFAAGVAFTRKEEPAKGYLVIGVLFIVNLLLFIFNV